MSRKTATSVFFVAAAATLGVYLSRGPWLAYQEQRAKADVASQEMEEAESKKRELLRDRSSFDTPQGREKLAREQGYLKKGEERLPDNP